MRYFPFRRQNFPVLLQHGEEDCGAACLAMIAKYHGASLSINRIREVVGTGQSGTTLLGLKQGAEVLGFHARTVRAAPEILARMVEVPLPAIIHWKGRHWVVLYGQQGRRYVVADPAVGLRSLTQAELMAGWTDWAMLLLEPDLVTSDPEAVAQQGVGRFFRRAWTFRSLLFEVLVLSTVLGLLSLANPFLIQILTDNVLVRLKLDLLNVVVIAVMVLTVTSSSLGLVQAQLIAHFAQRLELGLVLEFGRQILRLPLSYYEARRSGEIVSRLQDIQAINQLVAQVVVGLPGQLFVAVISLGLMLFYSGRLTLVALAIAVAMTLSTFIFLPTLQQKTRQALVLDAENQGVLVETFKGALTLKTTTAAPQMWEELQSRFSRLANLSLRTTQIAIINNSFSSLVSGVGSIALLWYGSTLVIQGRLSIGQLLAFSSMNRNFLAFIQTTIGFIDEFTRVKAATQRLVEVIDATPETKGEVQKPTVKLPTDADILCNRLNFYYPGRMDLLQDLSVTLPGGQVTALIGRSGCGKSTLAKLIAGFYSSQSGTIQVGLYDLQDIARDCLRQQISLVPQEPHFWSRSILENFQLGAPQVSFEDIVRACQIVGADAFIRQLPEKYQTVLGEFGASLSGGQRQRLAIARALITHPSILILDESTAGLDPVSEVEVLDRLLAHRQGQTTILISHRPPVINRADWIVLLDTGELVVQGDRQQLLNEPGPHLKFLGQGLGPVLGTAS